MSLLVILGPTAVGKTKLAVKLAAELHGEVISADSRQVYQGMDIGTGKDLLEYTVNGTLIPHHLIDHKQAGDAYNVFEFQRDFYDAYHKIIQNGKAPILCGGTGLYLEAAIAKEQMFEVPLNEELRKELSGLNQAQLAERLKACSNSLHNETDLLDRERTIRAIEIEKFKANSEPVKSPIQEKLVLGLRMERSKLRARIAQRLKLRLEEGMIEEVEKLLKKGVTHEQLNYYGLEYRFVSQYLQKKISYDEMYELLLQAIRRFAKKQMTWYRRMERKGLTIHWIDAELTMDEKMNKALEIINRAV